MPLTNGSVKYSLPSSFNENRPGVEVVLCFALPEGTPLSDAEAMLHRTGDLARAETQRLQAGKPAQVSVQEPAPAAQPPKRTRASGKPAEAAPASEPATSSATASSEPAEITDKDIKDLIHLKRTQHGVTGKQIRDLVLTFAETIREIAPEKRADFKAKLEALSKSGND